MVSRESIRFVGYGAAAISGMEAIDIYLKPIIGDRGWIYGLITLVLILSTQKIAEKLGD